MKKQSNAHCQIQWESKWLYISRNYLSMLIAHKLNIDAVHNSTSNDIQILQNTQPNCHDPENTNIKYVVKISIQKLLYTFNV